MKRALQLTRNLADYRGRPIDYAREVLHVDLWQTQQDICNALHTKPWKVMAPAAHGVGKTFLAAVLTSYWYDVHPVGSAVITTAPTARDVKDLLWREVRLLRNRAGLGGFSGPRYPELFDTDNHYAKGFTAERGESFQGRHLPYMLFIFDEAIGVDAVFWETTSSMFQPGGDHGQLAIGNPTDTSSEMYRQARLVDDKGDPAWTVIPMSAADHPNIQAEIAGLEPPFPAAVRLNQFNGWLSEWADAVPPGDEEPTDFEWPPAGAKCRCCGGSGEVA